MEVNNCVACKQPIAPQSEEVFYPATGAHFRLHCDVEEVLVLDPAKAALGQMLKLVEDGVLVRNTKEDDSMTAFVEQSHRLTNVLKQAQEALA